MTELPILERVRRRLAAGTAEATPSSVAAALRAEQHVAGSGTVLALVDQLRSETRGAGPLDPLLATPGVTDVLVNGPDDVYLDRGRGLEKSPVRFADEDAVRRLAQRLAAQAGRRLDDASPWVDARLADGTRLHAVLAPLARPGTLISMRVPARRSFSVAELRAAGSLTDETADILRRVVAARAAFVVTGGTGSGKTTLLSALLAEVDPAERLVIVEDATELRPDHPHVVGLEARPANVEGAGLVTVRDLVRQALRMRPDRLVVGEVRGAEVVDLLAALNTGHEGGCGTLHANSTQDVPARFEALGVAAGLPREAVHSQLAASLDLVVHLGRGADGTRRVQQIAVLERDRGGIVECIPALSAGPAGIERGPGAGRLQQVLD
ncbi:pilus assembly protein CpaF [Aeromicrobium sp. Root236]|uniref:TadA family conjugal transfer-associated ATPase n=1 Tax=Aeromicrobium sp. Root236 TaxID=1736498 RepID=UPI0006F73C59|nr:TadA family conjugal transfer-associated ATPase [Aeromicrobium sp. Root236]KRC65760.1 pilus assembly protein CpaF [Aeromicrobium sp. Root236]